MKQKQDIRKRKVSGFTLLEMVVVIAIISVLTGILVPTVRSYITRSRLNTANSNAKVMFNSIQTIMMEYQFKERLSTESAFYGSANRNLGSGETVYLFLKGQNGVIDDSSTGSKSFLVDADDHLSDIRAASAMKMMVYNETNQSTESADALGIHVTNTNSWSLGNRLSRLFTDYQDVAWAALIENYTVRGVICASSGDSKYVGGYPLGFQSRIDSGANLTLDGNSFSDDDPAFWTYIPNCSAGDMLAYKKKAWK